MFKKVLYVALMAAMVLTGCKGHNEVEEPIDGQEITLSFSMASDMADLTGAADAPARVMPGDPGKDDFIAPTNLYFILWVETTGHTKMMAAVKEENIPATSWVGDGKGIYSLDKENFTYKLIIPKDNGQVQQLEDGVFHVFAFASTEDMSSVVTTTGLSFGTYTPDPVTKGQLVTNTSVTLATLQTLTYALPAGITTQEDKRDFFRSMYSTALRETDHNQMATSPTIRLRHTATRVDINWDCDTTIHHYGLTPGSTWTLATTFYPTSFSLFKPGNNTGSTAWSEQITIDEGIRYNGRYVTYLPMPSTPTFTVTSNEDNLDGGSKSKTLPLDLPVGYDENYATWLRALWTIK